MAKRNPWRAALLTLTWAWMSRAISIMTKMTRRRSGAISANSTRLCPTLLGRRVIPKGLLDLARTLTHLGWYLFISHLYSSLFPGKTPDFDHNHYGLTWCIR